MKKIATTFLGLMLQFVGFAAWSGDQVSVESGKLQGIKDAGVVAYKGIPYAQPPTGTLRWKAPQPPDSWGGVRNATEFGADCMQVPFAADAAPLRARISEDCLYLNVWTPAKRGTAKLPVMVWIYGGGFVNGGTSPAVYDGTQFAKDGVVLVSFNYRLGRFGFFAHPALSSESPAGALGNYAFMDQVAALQWVRKNIAAFGGDPDNVTLFGESAGGISVHVMMTAPQARGLFQKAIIESGAGRENLLTMRALRAREENAGPNSTPSGEQVGIAFAKSMGITDQGAAGLAALRQLPAEKISAGLNLATMDAPGYAGPMIDGTIVVRTPAEIYRSGAAARIPVIVGANSQDSFYSGGTLDQVLAPFGTLRDNALAVYDPHNTRDVNVIGPMVSADMMMIEPARFVARSLVRQGTPVYSYRFSYVAQSVRNLSVGAPHATEIPFVFDTVQAHYEKETTAADLRSAKAIHAYWVAFAKTGTPAPLGLPHWPAYDPNKDLILDFGFDGPVAMHDPLAKRLDVVEAVAGGIRSDRTGHN